MITELSGDAKENRQNYGSFYPYRYQGVSLKRSGPPKKPTSLKLIQGTFRSDRALAHEVKPDTVIPPVPAHLTDEAKVEWGRISQELYQLGLLSNIDRAALAMYCQSWLTFRL